ncbi:MAG: DUF485 domain-containing protein [Alphaproteobacteria bacterium]|nr:DUF485 domain-containing protein [Alphaproteobacteria bacterium]
MAETRADERSAAEGAAFAARVRRHPAFVVLEEKRRRFAWFVAIAMFVIYYDFILLVAFDKGLLATDIGGSLTLAFPIGLGVIVAAIVLTGIYVLRANGTFDELTRRIREDVR